jgi:tetratricopeptide (TPR) repeat protein
MTDEKKRDGAPDGEEESLDWDKALSEWDSNSFAPEVAKDVVTDKPASPLTGAGASRPLYRPPPTKAAVPPVARPKTPGQGFEVPARFVDDDDSETRIHARPQIKAPPRRGGLGQLFAREERRDVPVDVSFEEKTVTPAGEKVPSGSIEIDAPFDPFADLGPPRSAQPTRPAESELEDLIANPPPSSAPEAPTRRGESILVPPERTYDPDEETAIAAIQNRDVLRAAFQASIARGRAQQVAEELPPPPAVGAPDPEPEIRSTTPTVPPHPVPPAPGQFEPEVYEHPTTPPPPPLPAPPVPVASTWADERPSSAWLAEPARESLLARAAWLEEEVRSLPDKLSIGRGLLGCSEILATAGELDRARALAVEARDLAPSLVLAHHQARALRPHTDDAAAVSALEAEARISGAGAAKTHSTLLIVETLLAAGNADDATKRLEQAARVAAADIRPAVARAARALARGDLANVSLRLPASGPLGALASAIAAALRLRGVERVDRKGETGKGEVAPDVEDPSEVALRARLALGKGNVAAAAGLVALIARIPELSSPAFWLASMLAAPGATTRADAAHWLAQLVERGDTEAKRALAARALEMGDAELLELTLDGADAAMTPPERLILSTLAGAKVGPGDPRLAVAAVTGMEPLAAAVAAIAGPPSDAAEASLRAQLGAGSAQSKAQLRVGRLLASSVPSNLGEVEGAIRDLGAPLPASARAVALELALRDRRAAEVSAAVEAWGSPADGGVAGQQGALAGALLAERAGDMARALEAFRAARAADPTNEAVVRAAVALTGGELAPELVALADALDASAHAASEGGDEGVHAATARLEAYTRTADPPAELLERANDTAPGLAIPAFLAEARARAAGNADEVLRWIHERRAAAADPVESSLHGLREALALANRDGFKFRPGSGEAGDLPSASERLLEAHHARPADVALRLLCERFSSEPMEDAAAWREARAAEAKGDARTLWYLEAALEYERKGDDESALRCSAAAADSGDPLGRVARERGELRAGNVARLADELLEGAKTTDDPRSKREAYERLATLDATARQDPASALLWHRAILEEELPDPLLSLRHVEHCLVGEGRDEELEPVVSAIAKALRGTGPGEGPAHAELAAKLRMRSAEGSWESAEEMVTLAAAESEATLWALHMAQAHARSRDDDDAFLRTTLRLLETSALRSSETGLQLTRAGEAAMRLGRLDEARSLLERGTTEDPGDVVAWANLAKVRRLAGDPAGAAEANEALARTSMVSWRQLAAWHDAARLWQDDLHNEERAIAALEAAAVIDVAYGDLFDRLSSLYARRKMQAELASLLERRIGVVTDPGERLAMEVRRGQVLVEVGDIEGARKAFAAALSQRPDDAAALSAFADLCVGQRDWQAAEEALVRLARLLPQPEQQRDVYLRLGDLYTHRSVNLSRAEVAFNEVLKRAPGDIATKEKLVDVYRRQNDAARAAELQQEIIAAAPSPDEKRRRIIELSLIHELTGHDNRRAEQTLEAARRESPQDITILRALANFYVRHQQTPAVNILLDRAGGDARRALSAGRFSTNLFEILGLAFEVRGKRDAAQVTQAMLAALEGRPAELRAAGDRAFDPKLDDLVAPEILSPAMRTLLAKTGEALDAASPMDVKSLKATTPPPDSPLVRLVTATAPAIGLGSVQVLVAQKLGTSCVPASSSPPVIVLGEGLLAPERERTGRFLVLRALKLLRAKAAAFARTPPAELAVLVSAWLKCFNPTWQPQGINPAALNAAGGRVQAALPRNRDPDLNLLALEVAGNLGTQTTTLAANALMWANRVALLALGNPNDAIDAIASAGGLPGGAPRDPKERAAWLSRTAEARDVLAFGVTDAFAEARARLGLDR